MICIKPLEPQCYRNKHEFGSRAPLEPLDAVIGEEGERE